MIHNNRAVLLFPPNWSACVSGPHLALPLLAGGGRDLNWEVETWDLTQGFCRRYSQFPSSSRLVEAAEDHDFGTLDKLYFSWEDQFQRLPFVNADSSFGLLSGFSFDRFRQLPLVRAADLLREGSVYTPFFRGQVVPRLAKEQPCVVAITIASQEQVLPAVELLQQIRVAVPDSFLVLGGNIVTRLRNTSAFQILLSLVDQTVLFQGELAFVELLKTISQVGVTKARKQLPSVTSSESVPHTMWPVPFFKGIGVNRYVGMPVLPFVSTRGCYWGKCHFCAIPAGWSSKGYGGSAPADFAALQLIQMAAETGIPRVKFVDEALPPSKVRALSNHLRGSDMRIEWEAYARLEPAWENVALLEEARAGGLRKLYLGLEQAPTTNRSILGKNDRGDPMRILHACKEAEVKVHLFCMVGHPGSSSEDAATTVRFLIENEALIDTADMVGFRLDRGTVVPGVKPVASNGCDWAMSMHFEPTEQEVLSEEEVAELEATCQEELWEAVPRLLHPLYRLAGHWDSTSRLEKPESLSVAEYRC